MAGPQPNPGSQAPQVRPEDVTKCATSGAVRLFGQPVLSAPFRVTPGQTYYIGFQTKTVLPPQPGESAPSCWITWCDSADCMAGTARGSSANAKSWGTDWQVVQSATTAPPEAVAAIISCVTDEEGFVDRVFFNASAAQF
jgi:hypothetical protein